MHSIDTVVVVRSFTLGTATARLHSQPILEGVRQMPGSSAQLVDPAALTAESVAGRTCLVFHFDDSRASEAIRRLRPHLANATVICLCSDIYSYQLYLSVQDIADAYAAPTEAHRRSLAYVLYKPVHVVPESIDTIIPPDHIAALEAGRASELRPAVNRRVTWFGYAESFAKGMASLVGELALAVESRAVEAFEVVTNLEAFARYDCGLSNATRTQYVPATFFTDLRRSSYALLSHIPLDLEVNSTIKSPNKLVTSVLSGLVPLCSDTENYAAILNRFGLGGFLFSSPPHLRSILAGLDPARDLARVEASGIVPWLLAAFSQEAVAARFLEVVGAVRQGSPGQPEAIAFEAQVPRTSSLKEHLRDLLPSARRSLEARIQHRRRNRS